MIAAGDHQFFGILRPEGSAFFVAFPAEDTVPVSIDTEKRHVPLLTRRVGSQQHKPCDGVCVRARIARSRDAAEGVACDDPVCIALGFDDLIGGIHAEECKVKRHFNKITVCPIRRDFIKQRRIGRSLHFRSGIEDERGVLARSVKKPGTCTEAGRDRISVGQCMPCPLPRPVIDREVQQHDAHQGRKDKKDQKRDPFVPRGPQREDGKQREDQQKNNSQSVSSVNRAGQCSSCAR